MHDANSRCDSRQIELPRAGLTVSLDFILEHCYAKPGDVVVISGSLVEGTGNAFSDIDVYVITSAYRSSRSIDFAKHHRVLNKDRDIIRAHSPETDVLLIHTVLPRTAVKVDVEFKVFEEVAELFARIRSIFTYAIRNLKLLTKRLSDREEILIHRLLHCRVVQNEVRFQELMSTFRVEEFNYVAYRWVASDFAILLDIAGAWHIGEMDRAVELARENVICQMSAYLRLRGITNLRRKWLLTYLSQLPDAGALTKQFLEFAYMQSAGDERGKAEYVLRTLDFVDELHVWMRPWLEKLGRVPCGEEAIALLEDDRSAVRSAYTEWEHDYRLRAYRSARVSNRVQFIDLAGAVPGMGTRDSLLPGI